MDFSGYSIGGLSVGEPKNIMLDVLDNLTFQIPENKPRYLMGVGKPEDFIEGIARGIDMFDCVLPTRVARNGTFFTFDGKVIIKNSKYTKDFNPVSDDCGCYVCSNYTRAYLRHLFINDEILGLRLATYHNLYFIFRLIDKIRESIQEERFSDFRKKFYERYCVK